jgi:hypothetical protein
MAAGLGFKTFTTGEVLTAADTNGYLMQGLLVFADAAARDAAITSPQEGQACYLKDTDAVLTYSGTAWVGFDDSNAIQNAIVDAKGDLISATGNDTPARLAVGNSGETLVADSAATVGLRYQANFAAGKNKIINGAFDNWQRGTSFSAMNGTYTSDRFIWTVSTAVPTWTCTRETFTPGTAPVAGYESQFFMRTAVTSQGSSTAQYLNHRVEDVRTFAGQTVTFSFFAKAASSLTLAECKIAQNFGSGGSSSVETTVTLNSTTIGTSWARFTGTVTLPSVSGKTIGASSFVFPYLQFNSTQGNYTFDTWGWQFEAGSVATAFQTATGTLQGELAACQRYYFRSTASNVYSQFAQGQATSTTQAAIGLVTPVSMRVTATSLDYSTLAVTDLVNGYTALTNFTIGTDSSQSFVNLNATVASGLTQYRPYKLAANNSTSGYVGVSAEL